MFVVNDTKSWLQCIVKGRINSLQSGKKSVTMFYKNICGFNLNLIKAALFIGCYDIFGIFVLIVMEIEFFFQSMLINFAKLIGNN